MRGEASNDQALWDRIRALKKGTPRDIPEASDPSASEAPVRMPIPLNEPPTAHDKLSDRLKLLRIQAEQDDASCFQGPRREGASQQPREVGKKAASTEPQVFKVPNPEEAVPPMTLATQPPSQPHEARIAKSEESSNKQGVAPASICEDASALRATAPTKDARIGSMSRDDELDSFLQSDDQTLEELLEDLALDEDLDPEPPEWALRPPFVPSEPPSQTQSVNRLDEPKSEVRAESNTSLHLAGEKAPGPAARDPSPDRVAALLEELSKRPRSPPAPKNGEDEAEQDRCKDDSDASDGEQMKAKIEQVVSRAVDDAALEPEGNVLEEAEGTRGGCSQAGTEAKPEASGLSLPEPPSTSTAPQSSSAQAAGRDLESRMAALLSSKLSSTAQAFKLPASNPDTVVPNFNSRLEALRALRSPSSSSGGGGLNLPDIPRNAPGAAGWKKTRYTDDDMENWCTVCLEDATLICPGCDDEAYCTRCWHAMHTGPQAGFDERSHRAEILEKGKKKRMLVGA